MCVCVCVSVRPSVCLFLSDIMLLFIFVSLPCFFLVIYRSWNLLQVSRKTGYRVENVIHGSQLRFLYLLSAKHLNFKHNFNYSIKYDGLVKSCSACAFKKKQVILNNFVCSTRRLHQSLNMKCAQKQQKATVLGVTTLYECTSDYMSWSNRPTLQALLSGTLLQTLPDLITPLKGHSLFPRGCRLTRSEPS